MSDRETTSRTRDLVLTQNEFALVQDGASAVVQVVRGPEVYSPGQNDDSMMYDPKDDRFKRCELHNSVQRWPSADERQYIVLTNPVKDNPDKHPEKGRSSAPDLSKGRKVNIPGPITFALFPGQAANVIDGHILRSNQYLMIRVSNGEEATKNWSKAVLKPQTAPSEVTADGDPSDATDQTPSSGDNPGNDNDQVTPPTTDKPAVTVSDDDVAPQLVTGQLLIIKGTEVSFYIPPTGIEVVPEDSGKYVREAVTLEQLEYCILLDESGEKEFVRGPNVVFPKPTQAFFAGPEGTRKFKAIELEEHWGIHIKIIKAYSDTAGETTVRHGEGDELFITGKNQTIYFPRQEHSIITYGDQVIHYAVAIPKGEARHVLNRETGDVTTVKGPKMFLPDPRKQVVVRRKLPLSLVKLLYPGNDEALEHNRGLLDSDDSDVYRSAERLGLDDDDSLETSAMPRARVSDKRLRSFGARDDADGLMAGDEFARKTSYTPPRTIQLDTKYDGAVTVRVWTGYAVKLVNKTGDSRVVVGPATVLLSYDEEPEIFELSTGTPKSDDRMHRDVFLRVKANKVSDRVDAETSDYVQVQIPLSYRVDFEGDNDKWFDVEDYVKFLTDHLRSLVANAVKHHGIEAFYANYIDILRDAILGTSVSAGEGQAAERPGRSFEENGMRIYDVEFGQLEIGDEQIAEMLQDAQHESVSEALKLANKQREFETTTKVEELDRKIADEKLTTTLAAEDRKLKAVQKSEEVKRDTADAEADTALAGEDHKLKAKQKSEEVARDTADAENETAEKKLGLETEMLTKELAVIAARVANSLKEAEEKRKADVAAQGDLDTVAAAELLRKKNEEDQDLAKAKQKLEQDVDALVKKAGAISPDLIQALQAFADKDLVTKVSESMAPMAIFGGKSIQEVLAGVLSGTPLDKIAAGLKGQPGMQPDAPSSSE